VLPAAAKPARPTGSLAVTPGIQLYSVEADLRKDFHGTLKRLGAMGYRDVELTDFFGRKPADLKQALADAGLVARSAHYSVPVLQYDFDKVLGEAQELGLEQMICASPRIPANGCPALTEWKWNASFLNTIGFLVNKTGMKFGYHNHAVEFTRYGGAAGAAKEERTGYDELIARTDPRLVTLQLDCGWAAAAGVDAAALIARHAGRISSLHVKDLRKGFKVGTGRIETVGVGRGALDWNKILTAAQAAGIARYYVELEPQAGVIEALEQSAAYLTSL
jgi:sugar phosphate isomerase/epimerase